MAAETPGTHARAAQPRAGDAAAAVEASGGDSHARQLRKSIISLIILGVLIGALLLAVPGLQGVKDQLRNANSGWIVVAIALEFASCFGYVLVFEMVFRRAPRRFATRLALSELAFGAAVSIGGAGSLALGAWVLKAVGVPTSRVAERSAVLFLATSAVNVIVLVFFSVGLATGIFDGPSNVLLGAIPAVVGIAVLAFFLSLPRGADRLVERLGGHRRTVKSLRALAGTIRGTEQVVFARDWRVLGNFAYLLCDIGVLWACFKALGYSPQIAPLVVAYQVGYLANIIPVPGGIGILDAGLIGTLVLYGISATPATAAVLVYHGIALWVPTVIGTIAFIRLRRQIKHPEEIRAAARRAQRDGTT